MNDDERLAIVGRRVKRIDRLAALDRDEGPSPDHAHRETLADRLPDLALIGLAILIVGYFSRGSVVEYGFGLILGAVAVWIYMGARR